MPKVRRKDKQAIVTGPVAEAGVVDANGDTICAGVIERAAAQFVDLPQRRLMEFDVDLTADDGPGPYPLGHFRDAVVKPTVRFYAGDEERATAIMEESIGRMREEAHHVREPKKIVVHEHVRRMAEIQHGQTPVEAARAWIENKRPRHVDPEDILARLKDYVERVADAGRQERATPEAVAFRSFLVRNVLPFRGLHVVDGIPDGVVGVIGKYDDQEDRSNRAGKSALMDAILLALRGTARDLSANDRLIHDTEKLLEAGVGLEVGDQLVPVLRSMERAKRGQKSGLSVGDAMVGVKEGNAEILKLLGMDWDDFLRTCWVRQGKLLEILERTSGQLKADIIRWKGLDIWFDIDKAIQRDESKSENALLRLRRKREVAQESVDKGRPTDEEIAAAKRGIKAAEKWRAKVEAAQEKRKGLEAELERALRVQKARETVESCGDLPGRLALAEENLRKADTAAAEARAAEEQAKALRRDLKDLERLARARAVADMRGARAEAYKDALERKTAADAKLADLRGKEGAALADLETCQARASGGFDGVCPVDRTPGCPRTGEINADRGKAKKQCAAAQKKADAWAKKREAAADAAAKALEVVDGTREDVADCDRADDLLDERADLAGADPDVLARDLEETERRASAADRQETDALEANLAELRGMMEEITKARGVVEANPDPGDPAAIRAELDGLEAAASEKAPDVDRLRDDLAALQARVKYHDEARATLAECAAEMEGLEAEARALGYLRHLCGKRGIPSMMIEDALAEIADQVNAILDELGTDFRLEFQSEREIQRPARTCEACGEVFPESEKVKFCEQCGAERGREKSDELRPMVREGDRLQEFDQDSGAGRSILALATRVVLSRFLGATILFLDEVCSALDDYHLPFMIRLLRRLPTMGFRQVFVISHQKQIAEATPCNILVVRFPSEARSTVGWEEAVA